MQEVLLFLNKKLMRIARRNCKKLEKLDKGKEMNRIIRRSENEWEGNIENFLLLSPCVVLSGYFNFEYFFSNQGNYCQINNNLKIARSNIFSN